MTPLKHTHGPWFIGESFTDDIAIREQQGQCVGFVIKSAFEEDAEEAQANACLIAAAPELLQRLEEALAMLEEFTSLEDTFEPIRATIKKAKGIQS